MARLFDDPAELSQALGIPFSDQQLAAITAPLAPGVVIAGAGSGKTTVMAARVVWLVGSGAVRPEQVLGLTFTRKAAGELSHRVRTALARAGVLQREDGEELVLTYDAFAGRLVAEHGLLLGLEDGWRMITGAARFRLAARVVADAPGPWQYLARLRPDSITQRVLELASELRSHLVDPGRLADQASAFLAQLDGAPTNRGRPYAALERSRAVAGERLELARLVVAYEELKQELGYVEFADQMAWAARLATEVPGVPRALREEFAVVLLDEYQDTSAAQATLLRGLFSGPDAASGRGHPVTAVGDPCQAIYTWRGAAASNILGFAGDFPTADGRPAAGYALTVNRRSGQRILDAANDLAGTVRADPALAATGLDLDLVCPPDTPPADVEVAEFATWPDELGWVADRIAAAHASGEVRRWADIAVLTRRNAHIGQLYSELGARGIPAEIVGLGGLLDLPAISEVVATLRLLADPADNPALVRLLTSPRWAIGMADLAALGRRAVELAGRVPRGDGADLLQALADTLAGLDPARVVSLLEAVAQPGDLPCSPEARERLALFAAEFAGLRRWASESVVDLTVRIIEVLGLEVELGAAGGDATQLRAFVEAVAGYTDTDGEASLAGLLAWLEAEREYGAGLEQVVVSDADSVKLLTVHKAKGLEWDLVLLPALAADVFPTDRVSSNWLRSAAVLPYPLRGDAASVPQLGTTSNEGFTRYAEALTADQRLSEDRLAYVAVTRARRRLVGSSHVWAPQLARPRRRSDYLEVLLRHAGVVLPAPDVPEENPLAGEATRAWPALGELADQQRRAEAAELVRAAREAGRAAKAGLGEPGRGGLVAGEPGREETGRGELGAVQLDESEQETQWRTWAAVLLAEARAAGAAGVPAAEYLSVTGVARLRHDPQGYAADRARPMPRLPGVEQRAGIAFHRWLEHRFAGQASLVDDLEPGADEVDEALVRAFLAGPYADAQPVAVEVPFTLAVGGELVRGRIDAVFPGSGRYRYQVVDWKTGRAAASDPLQLAHYRLAWAELAGVDVEQVDAVFCEVGTGAVIRPGPLPDRAGLEALWRRCRCLI
jgi:DNA helicase-2/ATP-dependent DNA helicase PcrA